MFIETNPNPEGKKTGDCVVRALATVFDDDWSSTYMELAFEGLKCHDMPSSNYVWGRYLREQGWKRFAIPNSCPDCYAVRDFAKEHPKGKYVLGTGTHVVAVIDGDYFDSWDSGDEVPIFYWGKL